MATEKRLIDANELLKDARRCRAILASLADIVDIEILVADAPTVDAVEVVHGRWVATPVYKFNRLGKLIHYCDNHHCSECKKGRPIVPLYNYCPNCGAKMDGDGNG